MHVPKNYSDLRSEVWYGVHAFFQIIACFYS